MTLEYLPNVGFQINSILFKWGEDRQSIRAKLRDQHKEDDNVIDMSEYFDGDESHNIHQHRDIYKDIGEGTNYFFLSYSRDHELQELEIHWGLDVAVNGVALNFGQDIDQYISKLSELDSECIELDQGSWLFKNLKLNVANSESMGGDGNGLSYFYGSIKIEHLLED